MKWRHEPPPCKFKACSYTRAVAKLDAQRLVHFSSCGGLEKTSGHAAEDHLADWIYFLIAHPRTVVSLCEAGNWLPGSIWSKYLQMLFPALNMIDVIPSYTNAGWGGRPSTADRILQSSTWYVQNPLS